MKKKTCKKIIFCIGLILLLLDIAISKYGLHTTYYTISSKELMAPFRVVQLSDIHNSEFGKNNTKLIKRVKKCEPDLILITGDLINAKEKWSKYTDEKVKTLLSQLSTIAPVYCSYGNHEIEIENQCTLNINSIYTSAGAIVLDNNYVDIDINGQTIRLGGTDGFCQPDKYAQESNNLEDSLFLKEFQNTDYYTLLMCHMPVCWLKSGSLYDWYVDVVFSGHVHGGQIRIPFIGGLYAPDLGFFPGQVQGLYATNEETFIKVQDELSKYGKEQNLDNSYYEINKPYEKHYLILSSGLGNTDWIPRFNNVPEIVVVDFVNE